MKIGYARVSTDEQRLDLQISALEKAGCQKIYKDIGVSGSEMSRPGLDAALHSLSEGESLTVWRLDRLGRSLGGVIQLIDLLGNRGINFHSITELIDTASSSGRFIFHIMAALSEFERSLISERTRAGLVEARARGSRIGRPRALSDRKMNLAIRDVKINGIAVELVAKKYDVSKRTMQRYLSNHNANP